MMDTCVMAAERSQVPYRSSLIKGSWPIVFFFSPLPD